MTVGALPGPGPQRDLSPAARAERHHAQLRDRRLIRRAVWRDAGGNRAEYRRLMAAWLTARRTHR